MAALAADVAVQWNAPNGGVWDDPNNWKPAVAPGILSADPLDRYLVRWDQFPSTVTVRSPIRVAEFNWTAGESSVLAGEVVGGVGHTIQIDRLIWDGGLLRGQLNLFCLEGAELRAGAKTVTAGSTLTLLGSSSWQGGSLTLSEFGSVVLAPTSQLEISGSASLQGSPTSPRGSFFNNQGQILLKAPGSLRIATDFLNSGQLNLAGQRIELVSGSFDNSGRIALGGGVLALPAGVQIRDGVVQGPGTVAGSLITGGGVIAGLGQETAPLQITGELNLQPGATVAFTAAGFPTQIDVAGDVRLRGTLAVGLPGADLPALPLVVLSSGKGVNGAFDNAPPGSRAETVDGLATFRIEHVPNPAGVPDKVVLSDWRPRLPRPVLRIPGVVVYGRSPGPGENDGSIWLLAGNGAFDVRLTEGSRPRLSPDRKSIAFLRGAEPDKASIFLRDLATGNERLLWQNDGELTGLDWTADGQGIVFDSGCQVLILPVNGGPAVVVGTQFDSCLNDLPTARPDGWLALQDTSLGLVIEEPERPSRLVPNVAPGAILPAWSHDGQWLAYFQNEAFHKIRPDGSRQTMLSPTKGFELARPAAGGTGRGMPAWSVDDEWLVLPGSVRGTPALYLVSTSGNGQTAMLPVTPGPEPNWVGGVVSDAIRQDLIFLRANRPVPSGLTIFANPLNTGGNTLNDILPAVPDGVVAFKFPGGQGFEMATFMADGGWTPNLSLPPGEALMLQNPETPFSVQLQGTLPPPVPRTLSPGGNYVGRPAPTAGDPAEVLGFVPPNGSIVQLNVGEEQQGLLTFSDGAWFKQHGVEKLRVPRPIIPAGHGMMILLTGPGIVRHPQRLKVPVGATASFSVEVASAGPVQYQWFRGTESITGATGPVLSLSPVTFADQGNYSCTVTDLNGTARSQEAALEVEGPLTILRQPVGPSAPVPPGGAFELSVEAVGTGTLRYRWFHNGTLLLDEVGPKLTRSPFQLADAGVYRVAVSDDNATILSDAARVLADVPLLPFTDKFDARPSPDLPFGNEITGLTGAGQGDNLKATAEPGEPAHSGFPASASVWLSWRPEVDGIATLSTEGSGFDTVLAVYRAAAGAPLSLASLARVAANDDAGRTQGSRVSFNVRKGETYFIAVDGNQTLGRGGRGVIAFRWEAEATPFRLPNILEQAGPSVVDPGGSAQFSLQLEPEPGAVTKVNWLREAGGPPISVGSGTPLTLNGVSEADVGIYYAEIVYDYGNSNVRTVRSEPYEIQLFTRSNGTDRDVFARDRFSRSRNEAPTSAPGAQAARSGRSEIRPLGLARGVSGTQVFTTSGGTSDEGEPIHCGVVGGASKWYAILADVNGVIEVDTAGSSFDTVLAIYYDTGLGTGLFDGLIAAECNNDVSPGNVTSAVRFCAQAGSVYYAVVDGVGGATGLAKLNYRMTAEEPGTACAPPTAECATGPALRGVFAGGSLTLAPLLSATPPVEYEWRRDGVLLPLELGATLTLTPAQASQSGLYTLRLRSAFGDTITPVARVRVTATTDPILGYELPCEGGLKLLFTCVPGRTLVLESSADLTNWTPLSTNTLAGGTGEYVIPAGTLSGASSFRVREN